MTTVQIYLTFFWLKYDMIISSSFILQTLSWYDWDGPWETFQGERFCPVWVLLGHYRTSKNRCFCFYVHCNTSECNSFSSPLAILWERFRRSWRSDRLVVHAWERNSTSTLKAPKCPQTQKFSHKSPICWVAFPEFPSRPPPNAKHGAKRDKRNKVNLDAQSIY